MLRLNLWSSLAREGVIPIKIQFGQSAADLPQIPETQCACRLSHGKLGAIMIEYQGGNHPCIRGFEICQHFSRGGVVQTDLVPRITAGQDLSIASEGQHGRKIVACFLRNEARQRPRANIPEAVVVGGGSHEAAAVWRKSHRGSAVIMFS